MAYDIYLIFNPALYFYSGFCYNLPGGCMKKRWAYTGILLFILTLACAYRSQRYWAPASLGCLALGLWFRYEMEKAQAESEALSQYEEDIPSAAPGIAVIILSLAVGVVSGILCKAGWLTLWSVTASSGSLFLGIL